MKPNCGLSLVVTCGHMAKLFHTSKVASTFLSPPDPGLCLCSGLKAGMERDGKRFHMAFDIFVPVLEPANEVVSETRSYMGQRCRETCLL